MDTILVVNAGSSSVKFQVFAIDGAGPQRLIKGQVDGVGTQPRLRAEATDEQSLIDQRFAPDDVKDVPAALQAAGAWRSCRPDKHVRNGL
jgi:acetate kinase